MSAAMPARRQAIQEKLKTPIESYEGDSTAVMRMIRALAIRQAKLDACERIAANDNSPVKPD
jgi:hypothetical protein